jgi:hypothetical protein
MDLEGLRRKYNFLNEFSDAFIRSTPLEVLLKAELSSRKLQDLDRKRRAEEKLSANRDNLENLQVLVPEGPDNRLDKLHKGRFLPGATCSAGKLWLEARQVIGEAGHIPLSTYDMSSFGLGGCVTPRGWVTIHQPASPALSIKMFSMGNCGARSAGQPDEEFPDMENLAEFKAALRVLRGAMVCVHPWNRSIDALESFLVQSNYCNNDLQGKEKHAVILTQFVDYVLAENANRWRGMECFLTTRELRNTWADFLSQKSSSMQNKPRQNQYNQSNHQNQNYNNQNNQQFQRDGFRNQTGGNMANMAPSLRYNLPPSLFMDDICVLFNLGRCTRAPGNCFTKRGTPLRHVCNYRADPAKQGPPCAMSHASFLFHK